MKNQPIELEVKADEIKAYCTCGKSDSMPFCDGSHKGSEMTPIVEKYTENKTVYICACGKSRSNPYCDGSHTNSQSYIQPKINQYSF